MEDQNVREERISQVNEMIKGLPKMRRFMFSMERPFNLPAGSAALAYQREVEKIERLAASIG